MLRNRLCYGLVLLGTSLFFLCYDGYLSYYVFFLSVLLPLFSLVLSLPGMLLLRLELSLSGPDPALGRCRKGEAATLRLTARCPWFLTGSRVKLRLTVKNTLTGERRREWLVFSPSREPLTIEHQVASPHCGLVECSLSRGKCCDLLGLFTLPLRLKKAPPCRVYFFPAVYRPALALGEQPLPDGEGDKYSPHKPGDDPTELFGLRPYREGDRLSRIHWKLSQKTGQTLVKELGLPVSERVLFLLDLTGPGEEISLQLDAFATLSGFLTDQGAAHRVGCRGKNGAFALYEIAGPEDALPVLETLLSLGGAAPLPPPAPEDLPDGVAHLLLLSGGPEEGLCALLQDRYPSARRTLLWTGPEGAAPPPGFSQTLRLRPGQLTQLFTGWTL